MAGKKISELADLSTAAAPTDLLTIFDQSEALAVNKNKRVSLTDLFAFLVNRIADKALRFTAPGSAPVESGASEAALYTDGTDMLLSLNGAPYVAIPLTTLQSFGNVGEIGVIDVGGNLQGYPEFFFDEANNRFVLGRSGVLGKMRFYSDSAPGRFIDLDAGSGVTTGHRILLPPAPPANANQILRVASISGSDIQLSYGPVYTTETTRLVTANASWQPNSDEIILVDTSAGDVVITLVTPGTNENNSGHVAKVSSDENSVILSPQAGNIAGAATFQFSGFPEGHGFVRHSGNWYLTN